MGAWIETNMAAAEKQIALRSLGQNLRQTSAEGAPANKIAALLAKWGFQYPLDIERAPLGAEVYTFRQHVVVPPARVPDTAPTGAGDRTPPGNKTRGAVFSSQMYQIVVIPGICAAPKNRTACEFGYVEYRGCIETDGRNLFCSPGTGNPSRLGAQQSVGNIVLLPQSTLQVLLWNADTCSEGKWSLKWTAYSLGVGGGQVGAPGVPLGRA